MGGYHTGTFPAVKPPRKVYMDVLRVIATVFVICVHTVALAKTTAAPGTLLFRILEVFNYMFLSCNLFFVMISGALLLPVGRLAMLKVIPRAQFLSAMSLMSLAGLIGPLIGPTLGGWLAEAATWHWIFLINIPMGILGCLITFKAMPNVTEPSVQRFDLWGFLLLVIAMAGLSLGIENFASTSLSLWDSS